jgi:hypothetical protein
MSGTDSFDPEALFEQLHGLMFSGACVQPLPAAEVAPLREHIAALLDEHRLTMREEQIKWLDAYADLERREIVVPPMDCELGYFVALHEIGHFVLGLDSGDAACRRYDNEATVDEWVMETALVAPSDDAEQKLVKFLITDEPGPGRAEAPGRVSAACAARRQRNADYESAE